MLEFNEFMIFFQMLPLISILLAWLSPALSQTQENSPKHYKFHPYHQPLYHLHQQRLHHQQPSENRRYQRTLLPPKNLRNPVIKLKDTVSSRHLSSPAYRFQPHSLPQRKPIFPERHKRVLPQNSFHQFKRKPILIRPNGVKQNPRAQIQKKPFQNIRETRKIANTKLKLSGNFLKSNRARNEMDSDDDKKSEKKLQFVKDNEPSESRSIETRVRLPSHKLQTRPEIRKIVYDAKPQVASEHLNIYHQKKVKPDEALINRNYNSAPEAPKFIIKQAGFVQLYSN